MEKKPIEIPSLTQADFQKILPPNLIYPGLPELFGHFSQVYLKQIVSKMNSYTWFRFVEAESKSLIFKKMATRLLYKMLKRKTEDFMCAGNENAYVYGAHAVGLCSRGVSYKNINEDGIGIFERGDERILVVCDGVGDCLVGEVASFVILTEFHRGPERTTAQIYADSVDILIQLGKDLIREIPEFITFPNEVSQAAVTAAKIKDDHCEIGQVGDVLFYHIRDGELRALDQNRKWQDLARLKKLFADEHYLAQRHIISNAVGRNYDPYWSPTYLTLKKGDIIVLASDGLETLHPQEVQDILIEDPDTRRALAHLYQRAIDANLKWNTVGSPIYTKPDNISILLYRHE